MQQMTDNRNGYCRKKEIKEEGDKRVQETLIERK